MSQMDYEQFESLDPKDQAKLFHESSIQEKGELLLRSHEPQRLVQSLSQEELYLVAKEMDVEERSEIIRYASLPQLFFISDLECWSKDRLHSKGFMEWLEILKKADDAQLFAWLFYSDYGMVISGFKKIFHVIKTDREYPIDEHLGDLPYFTLDDNYYIYAREEDLETIRRALEILFENHRGRYVAFLEGMMAEIDDMAEEEAYQNRLRRLADRGFPDPETAHHIYKPISKEEYDSFPLKLDDSKEPLQTPVPNYLSLWKERRLFLDDVLLYVSEKNPALTEQIKEELAWIANKVITCEGIDFSSEEKVRRGVERARNFVSLGLEILSSQDLDQAYRLLSERWLEVIFRVAVTQIFEAVSPLNQVFHVYWGGKKDYLIHFINSPYQEVLKGILRAIPEIYDPAAKKEDFFFRDFNQREDLEKAKAAALQISLIHSEFDRHSPGIFNEIQKKMTLDEKDLSLFQCLSQFFVLHVLKKPLLYRPLTKTELLQFMQQAFTAQGKSKIWKEDLKNSFIQRFFMRENQDMLLPLWSHALEYLLEEIGSLSPTKKIKPEFISAVELKAKS